MILLLAFGKRGYAHMAYNLAFSIKQFSKVPICIYHDGVLDALNDNQKSLFDIIERFEGGNPGYVKTRMYELSPFEKTLYVDVDSLALQDISTMIQKLDEVDFFVHIPAIQTRNQNDPMQHTTWAWSDDVWKHFNLPEDAKFPLTNTSMVWFKKSPLTEKIFTGWKDNINTPIPVNRLREQWGAGQPDELYLSASLAQHKVEVPRDSYMFFGNYFDNRTFNQLQRDFYFMTIWGGRGFTKLRYCEWYDRLLESWHRQKGLHFAYKFGSFIDQKHANKRGIPAPREIPKSSKPMIKAEIPIEETVKINSSNLIQEYIGPRNEKVKVTNWFNCSICEFNGEYFFAYRMESYPWCKRMKIGLCKLDNSYQPIKETNVIPKLYSNLILDGKRYDDGFHVEDPRLFIYDDRLFLSYTDGYQMGQAEIDPFTLEAINPHYIEKPDPKRTEKNWTFFENEKNLYCVYQPDMHDVYQMNGVKMKPEVNYKTRFNHEWAQYGQMRGGTSPILVNDKYVAFFHSAKEIQHRGRIGKQYFMGCYMFDKEPPFRPRFISKSPILAGELIEQAIPRLSNKIYVVFPNGAIRKDDHYIVTFGYNDLQCRYVKVTDDFLKSNLVEIFYEPIEV